jgi:hypothetical protein
MLEAQPLDEVVELDVDAEVVAVELELVAVDEPTLLVDVHGDDGDLAVDVVPPVSVLGRVGLERDLHGPSCSRLPRPARMLD